MGVRSNPLSDEEDDQEVMSVMIHDEVCCMLRTYAGLSEVSTVSRCFVEQLTLRLLDHVIYSYAGYKNRFACNKGCAETTSRTTLPLPCSSVRPRIRTNFKLEKSTVRIRGVWFGDAPERT